MAVFVIHRARLGLPGFVVEARGDAIVRRIFLCGTRYCVLALVVVRPLGWRVFDAPFHWATNRKADEEVALKPNWKQQSRL